MIPLKFEHELVIVRSVDEHTEDGWEPTPHTQPVLDYSFATPTTYVWMRRIK